MEQRTEQTGARNNGGMIGLQGRRRMLELAAQAEAERKAEESVLIDEVGRAFGRAPTRAEAVLLENAAALVVLGRKLRRMSKLADSENSARLLARILRQVGLVDHHRRRTPKRSPVAPRSPAETLLTVAAAAHRSAHTDAQAEGAEIGTSAETRTSTRTAAEGGAVSGEATR
jgi:hypothetical protein